MAYNAIFVEETMIKATVSNKKPGTDPIRDCPVKWSKINPLSLTQKVYRLFYFMALAFLFLCKNKPLIIMHEQSCEEICRKNVRTYCISFVPES